MNKDETNRHDPGNRASETLWECKPFQELTPDELYRILRLRSEVFVVEQECIYLDMDDKDPDCHQIMGWRDGLLAASARILPPGTAYHEPSIGRVVSSPKFRKTGLGRKLMEYSVGRCRSLHGEKDIRIGAQLYLLEFYRSLGFTEEGDTYLEDGIPHVEMLLSV